MYEIIIIPTSAIYNRVNVNFTTKRERGRVSFAVCTILNGVSCCSRLDRTPSVQSMRGEIEVQVHGIDHFSDETMVMVLQNFIMLSHLVHQRN